MDGEGRRLADYFIVAGLPDKDPVPLQDSNELEEVPPIVDIAVIIASQKEVAPLEYHCIEKTPLGHVADLNHGSIRCPNVFLCYRRGLDKPPLMDIGVLYEDKQRIMPDSEVLEKTPYGRIANVNNSSSSKTFLTYRRALETAASNTLIVKDICVILTNKGETPPHAFCKIEQNLNKGVIGSDVYICYKKSVHRPQSILYRPETLLRYPMRDKAAFQLPKEVHLFCLPLGASVEKWKVNCDDQGPAFSTFVFTSQKADRAYGASLSFYEAYEPTEAEIKELGGLSEKEITYQTKSICLVSRWPFFHIFRKFLKFLYAQSFKEKRENTLEQYVLHFLYNIPFPSIERPRVVVPLNENDTLVIRHLTDTPLPMSGASFVELLCNLGPDNSMMALLLVLTENKILIHSLRPQLVTCVSEALVSACFPCRWQCPYVPLCPLGVSEIIMAPLPFLAGVDSRYFDLHELPSDVVCIDLDTNAIYMPDDKQYLSPRMMPKKPSRKLRSTLLALYDRAQFFIGQHRETQHIKDVDAKTEADFRMLRKERDLDLMIQEAFLKFMVEILRDFRNFLRPVTEKPKHGGAESLFDVEAFMRSKDKSYHQFYNVVVRTQMFSRLVEERSFVSENDQSLAFFDECCDRCDSSGEAAELILHIEAVDDNHTAYIAPPEPPVDSAMLKFAGWSKMDFESFSKAFAEELPPEDLNGFVCEDPGSPVIKRTKHEMRSAIKSAQRQNESPAKWGRLLLSTCYSIWFVHLPSYICTLPTEERGASVRLAFQILCHAQQRLRHPVDEVCYRVILSLCAQLCQPALAVKVLMEMKKNNIIPNAMTYGYYNKAVMASPWPASRAWSRLRNVVIGVAQFKRALRRSTTTSVAASTNSLEGITRMSSTLSLPRGTKETYVASAGLLMGTSCSKMTPPSTPSRSSPANSLPRTKSSINITMEKIIREETAFIKFKTLSNTSGLLEQPKEFFAKTVSPSLQRMVAGAYSSTFFQNFQLAKIRRFSAGPMKQPDLAELRRPNSSPTARPTDVMSNLRSMASRLTGMINTDVYSKLSTSRSLDQMFNKYPPNDTSYTSVNGSTNGSSSDLCRDVPEGVDITMSSCCQCVSCKSLVYDEEIMSGWSADDSNLKTKCWCNASFVPLLYVTIKDKRNLKHIEDYVAPSIDFTVPYLSPLVLQKEVENVLEQGVEVFTRTTFVDDHYIIYWNLLWYFWRLRLPTHISVLCTRSLLVSKGSLISSEDSSLPVEVVVRTLWDNSRLHECVTPPLYTVYKPGDIFKDENDPLGFKRVGREMIEYMKHCDVREAVLLIMKERQRWKFRRNPSIYREILFLLILEFGANIINPEWLNREYHRVYDELSVSHRSHIFQYDKYPSLHARFARRYFGDLDLI